MATAPPKTAGYMLAPSDSTFFAPAKAAYKGWISLGSIQYPSADKGLVVMVQELKHLPRIYGDLVRGIPHPHVQIHLVRGSGDSVVPYLMFLLKNVLITRCEPKGKHLWVDLDYTSIQVLRLGAPGPVR